jgi:putative nucleotidyltransferase with HDIG domain
MAGVASDNEASLAGQASSANAGSKPTVNTADAVLSRSGLLSPMGFISERLMGRNSDPFTENAALAAGIKEDADLVRRVLHLVAALPESGGPLDGGIEQAVEKLGPDRVRALAVVAAVRRLMGDDRECGRYRRLGLGRHLLWVALGSHLLARRAGQPHAELAFIAGLLHDVGILLAELGTGDRFAALVTGLRSDRPFTTSETEVLGLDHTLLGDRLAEVCGFHPAVRAVVRHHHRSQEYDGEYRPIVQCVEVANAICTLRGVSSMGACLVTLPLGISPGLVPQHGDMDDLVEDLERRAAWHESLLSR